EGELETADTRTGPTADGADRSKVPRRTFPGGWRGRRRGGELIGRPSPPRRRGSSTSRSASPSMLNPKTAREIAAPGQMAIHGARYMNDRPEPESIAPHDG